jgi:hypothetical protein
MEQQVTLQKLLRLASINQERVSVHLIGSETQLNGHVLEFSEDHILLSDFDGQARKKLTTFIKLDNIAAVTITQTEKQTDWSKAATILIVTIFLVLIVAMVSKC